MRLFIKKFLLLFVFLPEVLFAETDQFGISLVAERLIFGAEFITRLLFVICIAMGIALIVMSVTFYRAHRFNPKMIPLGKPVMYLILGLAIASIPFLEHFVGGTGNPLVLKNKNVPEHKRQIYDIDAPLEYQKQR